MQNSFLHRLCLKLRLLGLALVALSSATPSLATDQSLSPLLAQSSNHSRPVNFEANPELCSGQVVSNGQICIIDLPATQRPGQRLAMKSSLFTDPNIFTRILTTIRVIEMEPNQDNLAYSVFVDDATLPDQFNPDGFDRPLLFFSVRNDGAVAINTDYGEYPPGFDQEEEANRLLNVHFEDIQQLINALMQTRP
ncbi:MAG: hypothetical protein ACTS2F_08075 [Thainema sp.]